ncbi:MAG: tetratricopeptide repeat protein [Acidobacteria bacterium]|nr:tetratricopeptide repeat protein [Acidobacteriota bacterium]
MDRDDTLRRAEKLLRQGRLDAAIEAYAAVVEAHPKDWATANLLGDLYIRAGRTDRAVAQYSRIADRLAAEGFLSKAAALYKKIVKITPDDEEALLRTAEMASQQGLFADARHVLHTLFQRRLSAGDRAGAAGIAGRLAALDPGDVVGRLDASRMFAEIGDPSGAADQLRQAGDTLVEQGRDAEALRAWREAMRLDPGNAALQKRVTSGLVRQGELDEAMASAQSVTERRVVAHAMIKAGRDEDGMRVLEQVLDAEPDHLDTRLQLARMLMARQQYLSARDLLTPGLQSGDSRVELALAETDLRSGMLPAAADMLRHVLEHDPASVDHVAALGASLTADQPDVAFVAIDCALEHLVGRGEFDVALKMVERFVAAEPGHVPALERFAQLCRDGSYEDTLYRIEGELTEAYLARQRFADALPVARRLAGLRPDVARHVEQVQEALAGMGEPIPVTPAESDGVPSVAEPIPTESGGPLDALDAPVPCGADIEEEDPLAAPPLAPDAKREPSPDDDVIEIELADLLDALTGADMNGTALINASAGVDAAGGKGGEDAARQATPSREEADSAAGDLDDLFRRMREQSGRGQAEADATRAYDEASVHYRQGRFDQAIACLRRAGRDPIVRFRATVMLARIATDRGHVDEAITWFERAAESPAPSDRAERSLLYELGVALERAGEPVRAQAVFLELSAIEPGYRNVAARLQALAARLVI